MTRYASYLSPEWGTWAQYCRAQAGFYPDFPRKVRRKLEMAAHAAGIVQIPNNILRTAHGWLPVEGEVKRILEEAAS